MLLANSAGVLADGLMPRHVTDIAGWEWSVPRRCIGKKARVAVTPGE